MESQKYEKKMLEDSYLLITNLLQDIINNPEVILICRQLTFYLTFKLYLFILLYGLFQP